MGSFIASSFFLRLLHGAGGGITFLCFAIVSFGAVLFVALTVPETKDKEPHQIEHPDCGCCFPYSELRDESLDATTYPNETVEPECPTGQVSGKPRSTILR